MAPFELLPNEMAEIPIKMAMAKMHRPLQKYEFLANVIAKISTRETSERTNGECACGHIFWKFSRFLLYILGSFASAIIWKTSVHKLIHQ